MLKHATVFAILTVLSCGLASPSQADEYDICRFKPTVQTALGALPPNILDLMHAPASDIPPEVADFFGIRGPRRWDQSRINHTLVVMKIWKDAATAPNSYSALVLSSRTGNLEGETGRYHCISAKINKKEKGWVLSGPDHPVPIGNENDLEYWMQPDGGLTGVWNDPRGKDTISLPRAIMPKPGQKLVEAPR
jgi:hypothetical protein